jgi:hypothetical protein
VCSLEKHNIVIGKTPNQSLMLANVEEVQQNGLMVFGKMGRE